MKIIFLIMLVMLSLSMSFAQPPNNAIFSGGNNDGFSRISFAQAASDIFTGGNNDGVSRTAFSQVENNIFNGGLNDGWSRANFQQAVINIFTGGFNDGWTSATFLQAGNAIFQGGNGDGWSNTIFLQPGNNIFMGGIGDGWSSTYRPMGPIPVHFLYFNANKQGTTSVLNWRTSQEINAAYFDVERSVDAVNFMYIGKVNSAGNSQVPMDYYFTDHQPSSGANYYRLKQVDLDGRFIYTPARLVRFDEASQNLVKYYPNPANGVLNIELPQSIRNEPKVVNISNTAGIVLEQLKLGSNNSSTLQLNMGNYPRGIYFVHVKTANINSVQRIVLQ